MRLAIPAPGDNPIQTLRRRAAIVYAAIFYVVLVALGVVLVSLGDDLAKALGALLLVGLGLVGARVLSQARRHSMRRVLAREA